MGYMSDVLQDMINLQNETDKTNLKFKEYAQNQVMLIPPTLNEMINGNYPVRIVNQVIDRIDIDPLIAKFKGGGTLSYHPGILLAEITYENSGSSAFQTFRRSKASEKNVPSRSLPCLRWPAGGMNQK